MNHPPTHPGWKRIVLNGGPNDGQELTIRGTRNMVVTGITDDGAVDPRSVEKGAVYIVRGYCHLEPLSPEPFDFLGHRTTAEIHDMLRGGLMSGADPADCGDADWWKQ